MYPNVRTQILPFPFWGGGEGCCWWVRSTIAHF